MWEELRHCDKQLVIHTKDSITAFKLSLFRHLYKSIYIFIHVQNIFLLNILIHNKRHKTQTQCLAIHFLLIIKLCNNFFHSQFHYIYKLQWLMVRV